MKRAACLLALGGLALLPGAGFAAPPVGDGEGGVRLKPIGKFRQPVGVVTAPGFPGLTFVVERLGRIRVLRGGVKLRRPFLDIEDLVGCAATRCIGDEGGLLALAFPPDYRRSRLLYIYYSDQRGNIRLEQLRRARRNPAVAVRASRRTVLALPDQLDGSHYGGQLLFRGRVLYLATGDGGGRGDPRNRAQSRFSLHGKILRIVPRGRRGGPAYTVPRANPFVGRRGRDEIFSLGLRNPFRFSIHDPGARRDRLVVTDVGQARYEEINFLPLAAARGANFGWDAFEGHALYDCGHLCPGGDTPDPGGTVAPIFTYGHHEWATPGSAQGCSVIGGHLVRDRSLRSLYGRYLYTDFCSGEIRSLIPRTAGAFDEGPTGLQVDFPTSFGKTPDGRIFVATLDGPVYRLLPE
jgi:glucose/arabinose dehydrogenase